jgi:hypothetical protein
MMHAILTNLMLGKSAMMRAGHSLSTCASMRLLKAEELLLTAPNEAASRNCKGAARTDLHLRREQQH